MTRIDKSKTREIIDDFANEIQLRKELGPKPQKTVIYFRDERKNGIERDVYNVPIDLLRYRKDNGRIRADVMSYEKIYGVLDESTKETQEILKTFLSDNDTEKNLELHRSIQHDGQREPAIITSDGFLINGNRRKMTIERINEKKPGNIKFMKVVILPGKNDPGGPPTLIEIEEIENRYQHQSEGKAEYTMFNTALSIQRKIEMGISLEEQLRDDPIYAGLDPRTFKKEVKRIGEEYLKPLDCIDRYLETLGREGLYRTISSGTGDREGRWQSFLDYYNRVYKKLSDQKTRIEMGIHENEIGKIEDVAFKIIRQREFPFGKAHMIIRDLSKWIESPDIKKELFEINKIPCDLEENEALNSDGYEHDESTLDKIWSQKHRTEINRHLKKAIDTYDEKRIKETPITLLEASLKKLEHDDMLIEAIHPVDYPKARKIIKRIRDVVDEIDKELYELQKKK